MKILRILLLVLSCASSLVGWAWNIYRNGVLYQFRDSHYVDVVNVFEEAGPDVIFPESIVYDGVEYTVWSLKLNRFGNDKYPYYRFNWDYRGMRSMHFSKYTRMPDIPSVCESTFDYIDILGNWYNLDEITVDPENEGYASYDGCLYQSVPINKYNKLILCPVGAGRKGTIELHPDVRILGTASISNGHIKTLVIPKSVEGGWYEALDCPNLRHLLFEGRFYGDDHYFGVMATPPLRSLAFADCVEKLTFDNLLNLSLVKVSPFKDLEEVLSRSSRIDAHIMHLDFPDIVSIGYKSLDYPQSVTIGDKRKHDRSDYKISSEWLDPEHPVVLCVNALTPPYIRYKSSDLPKKWTVYVPAESVEAYKSDEYWGSVGEILPITDKLIPLVSEPELEIEQYVSHEYLWDVMPLGEAVAADRGEWTSEDPSVATIDENGVLTAIGQGETTITFTLADTKGNLYTAESKVTVVENVSGVEEIEDEPVAVATESTVPDGVYDLHGRRVGDTTDSLAPGLYIVRHQGKTEKRLVH